MSSIFDSLYSGLSSVSQAVLDAVWGLLEYIARTAEGLITAMLGPTIDNVVTPLSDAISNSWTSVKTFFLAVDYFLPLKECLALIVVLWLLWGQIVVIRWILKFIPTLSS